MKSTDLFEDAPQKAQSAPKKAPSRLFWIVPLASIVPGGGHFVLGHPSLAVALLLLAIFGTAGGAAARFFEYETLGWFLHRAALIAWVFSLLDAALLEQERVDNRTDFASTRAREAGLMNALGWGLGFLRIGERGLGAMALLLGAALHVVLAMRGQPLVWIAEAATIGLSFWGATKAEYHGHGGHVSTEFGEMDRKAQRVASTRDTSPGWLAPVTLGLVSMLIATGLTTWSLYGNWLSARVIDKSDAVAVEPYYRHPGYGVSMEMNTPGWVFRETTAETFVFAQHVAEETRVSLRLRPRVPLFASDRRALRSELKRVAPGLVIRDSGPANLGGLEGERILAEGIRGNRRHFIELFAAGEGFQRFILQAEWTSEHEAFAKRELGALLENLSLDGKPKGSLDQAR